MKKIKIILMLFMALISNNFYSQKSSSQKESLPIDSKTNCFVRYYYFPNLEVYFDNLEMVYYYKVNNEWETAEQLPTNYGGYSLYNKVKVSITDYDSDKPYLLIKTHKKMYPYNSKGRFTNQTASSD